MAALLHFPMLGTGVHPGVLRVSPGCVLTAGRRDFVHASSGGTMRNIRAGSSRYEIPELDESDFTPAFSRGAWIEDSNDIGEIGDSFSIALDTTGADDSFAADF